MASVPRIDIPLSKIHAGKFCLRHALIDAGLLNSLREYGLLEPLIAAETGGTYELIGGHKRYAALKKLKVKKVPLHIVPRVSDARLLEYALVLNNPSSYSDLDRMKTLVMAGKEFQISEAHQQKTLLPLLGLPASGKILKQYTQTAGLPSAVLKVIEKGELPFQGAAGLLRLKSPDLHYLTRKFFPVMRLTSSQLAHLAEWLYDLSEMRKLPLSDILRGIKLAGEDLRSKGDQFYRSVRALRFPAVASKEKMVSGKIRQIDANGFELKAPDGFEEEGVFLKAHIRSPAEWRRLSESLLAAESKASALFDTLL